ncbi:hypothetical protein AFI02nite_23300 [Aliivibrio fischeri]|uniref:Uncharacterized protein n=1 Tax=Aliivibrio fischeri TaxID=668 RepID=A0A510UI24_ALIFS|nr:hypothetical protein AFI02nite_23300 [Aliivibrio fischeri]
MILFDEYRTRFYIKVLENGRGQNYIIEEGAQALFGLTLPSALKFRTLKNEKLNV